MMREREKRKQTERRENVEMKKTGAALDSMLNWGN